MKTKLSTLILTLVLGLSGATFTANAFAEEGKMVGPVTTITFARLAAPNSAAVSCMVSVP